MSGNRYRVVRLAAVAAALVLAGSIARPVPVSASCDLTPKGDFYEHENLGGDYLHMCWGTFYNNLGNIGWNDRISGYEIVVPDGEGFMLYWDINYHSPPDHPPLRICGTSTRLTMPSGWNDAVSSIASISNCPRSPEP